MGLVLDTNALSAFADGDEALWRLIQNEAELAVPVVVVGEYLAGIRQSGRRAEYEQWLSRQLRDLVTLPVRTETAQRYAEVWLGLKAAGRPIPSNDLWIAAVALEYGGVLVTRDRHFEWVSGLRVVRW